MPCGIIGKKKSRLNFVSFLMFTMCYLEISTLENFYFLNELQRIYSMVVVTFRKISLKTKQNLLSIQKIFPQRQQRKKTILLLNKH